MSDDRMPEELRNELESDCEVIYERQRVWSKKSKIFKS
jgi:hypothetical protein